MQAALRLIYPGHCVTCSELVEGDFGVCPSCWGKTHFIDGLTCDACGVPLPGQETAPRELCDECMTTARPWSQGRAAMMYKDNGRRIVLALKHGDRHDIARPAGKWLARVAAPMLQPNMLIAPVPLHWTRLLKRRFNQSALLAQATAKETGLSYCPDLLVRLRRTPSLNGLTRDQRFATLSDAINVHTKRRHRLTSRPILLVDDVMTSGATLAAAAEACLSAGAADVYILTLARVAKDA